MSKGKLIIIVGKSGSGKTKLANEVILSGCLFNDDKYIPSNIYSYDPEYPIYLSNIVNDDNNSVFYAKKYVTRDIRKDDVGVIKGTKEEIGSTCDVIVPGYNDGDIIGINMNEIIGQIDQGKSPVLVTGFMELVQLILKKLNELGRLDDVFLVGINSFLNDEKQYADLEQSRYETKDTELASQSADSRFKHTRLFARQYAESIDIFDWIIDNYRMKYAHEKDLRGEGAVILNVARNPRLWERDEKQKKAIIDFICCDLKSFEPVQDSEIKRL